MKLLLVDDEPLELEQLTYLVKKEYPNWEVYTAEDAFEARQLLKSHFFPLAFVDIELPGDSGLTFCEYIREQGYQTEVVLITAYQDFTYAKQAIRLQVLEYLVKPVIANELYKVIDQFLTEHTYTETKSVLINRVLDIVRQEFNEKLHLADVASQVFVTPTYLSKKFTEEVGIKFTEYVNQYRIEKAKQLLVDQPEMSLFEVAERVGFSSQHHFSHSFKKIAGIPPSKYKGKRP
jgi:two-component system, response regulator YesN